MKLTRSMVVSFVLVCGALLGSASSAFALASEATVTTLAATGVGAGEATLNGTLEFGRDANLVTPRPIRYAFDYGTTKSYGEVVPQPAKELLVGEFSGLIHVSQRISGLALGVPYHFRLVAIDSDSTKGEVDGKDEVLEIHRPEFWAEHYPTTIAGEPGLVEIGTALGTATAKEKCKSAQESGTLSGLSSSISLNLTSGPCTFLSALQEVEMHSCHFQVTLANTNAPYSAAMAIACTKSGDAITYGVGGICEVSIAPQTAQGSVAIKNDFYGGPTFRVDATVSLDELAYTESGPFCSESSYSDGTFTGSFKLGGVSGFGPTGVLVQGQKVP